ncbi:DgyrCDS14474 [Dimorphilus gyrociliatus]|uniref:DgyrCDS14474 n=1 Tax=Dimorphilus gyrociliatus TaxID=2664684 RepID=A0A7I8WDR3_9ANNE|nr:DgyrCDS14474 [Dimorphilus gyrociliatus]
MKTFFLYFCCYYLISVSSCFICPTNDASKPIDGTYRDGRFCDIYYHCINGTAYQQRCPPGLFFKFFVTDCALNTCVELEFADCPHYSNRSTINSYKQCNSDNHKHNRPCFAKTDECAPDKNITVPSLVDCRIYYHCQNGVGWPQTCPPGYFYEPKVNSRECTISLCLPEEEANCPTAGSWSEWSAWGDCEPICGEEGIQTRIRECNNPPPSNGGDDCPGVPIEIRPCMNPNCSDFEYTAFMVSMERSVQLPKGKVKWSSVDLNINNLFSISDNSMNIKDHGIYFTLLTATTASSSGVSMTLRKTGTSIGLTRTNGTGGWDVSTRAGLFSLSSLFSPTIEQDFDSANVIGTNVGKETAWLGFKYRTDSYLFAATDYSANYDNEKIPLANIITMKGFEIDVHFRTFKTQNDGLYFIHFGSRLAKEHKMYILTYPYYTYGRYISSKGSRIRPPVEYQVSRGCIVESKKRDISFNADRTILSSSQQDAYLIIFKLNSDLPAVTVEVKPKDGPQCSLNSFSTVRFDYVKFDTTNAWDKNRNLFIANLEALYYVDATITAGRFLSVEGYIEVNGMKMCRIVKFSTKHLGGEVVSRGCLVKLKINDILKLIFKGCLDHEQIQSSLTIFAIPKEH